MEGPSCAAQSVLTSCSTETMNTFRYCAKNVRQAGPASAMTQTYPSSPVHAFMSS